MKRVSLQIIKQYLLTSEKFKNIPHFYLFKMNYKKVVLFCLIFIGITFLGKGITGLYILDYNQQPCDQDSNCNSIKACCTFYQQDYGVCADLRECEAIYSLSREENDVKGSDLPINEKFDQIQKRNYLFSLVQNDIEEPNNIQTNQRSIIAGLVIIIIGVLILVSLRIKRKQLYIFSLFFNQLALY